jgi:hypothetical protein
LGRFRFTDGGTKLVPLPVPFVAIIVISISIFRAAASLAAEAQPSESAAKSWITKYANSYDTAGLLREPAVHSQLRTLLGPQIAKLMHNLDVKGAVDVIGGALKVEGNAPHGGTEEEAVVCVNPMGPIVQAAIYSKGKITVYAADGTYDNLMLCVKDWVTQVNSGHIDRLRQPKSVRVVKPR